MSLYSRLDRVAADQLRLERKFDALANSPQSQRTSVEGGGSFDFNDADGNLMAIVGGQEDGSSTIRHVDGPTPPAPTVPILSVDGPVITSEWDGGYDGEPTYDLDHIDVIASGPSGGVLRGTMTLGGTRTCLLAATVAGEWTVRFEAVSKAGKISESSPFATVTVELVGLTGAIEAVQDSANGKNRIYYSPTEPEPPEGGFNNGDLWFDTSEDGNNVASVWNGTDWVSLEDARIAAIQAAQEELNSDLQDVMTSVDGKTTITFDPAAPTSARPGKAVGDMWYRTSGNSIIGFWKWTGTTWVAQMLAATVIPLIDIGAGTFGSLSGSRLDAYSVTAEKVLIGGANNLLANPGFDQDLAGWDSTGAVAADTTVKRTGASSLKLPAGSTGTLAVAQKQRLDVRAGQVFKVAAWIRNSAENIAGSGSGGFRIHRADTGGELSGGWKTDRNFSRAGAAGEWTKIENEWTSSFDGQIYFRVAIATPHPGDMWIDDLQFLPMVGATLIENGAITTDKMAVGAITAESGIIASFDLGKGTVGELDGIRIKSKTVGADQLAADFADFVVARGGTFLTSKGDSWSDDGLFIFAPDGTSLVRFPTDGTPLSLTASDVQIDRASVGELDTTQQTVRSGGTVTLASGVTAPASPPELSAAWRRNVQLPRPTEASMDWTGLAYWNGKYVRGVNVLGSEGDPYDRIEVYNSDGTLNKSISIDLNPRAGVTVIGDIVYTIGPDHVAANAGKQWCHGFNLNTGARVSRWEFTRFFSARQKKIAVGTDGANLMVAGVAPGTLLSVFKYAPATGSQVGAQLSVNFDTGTEPDLFGVAETGGKIYVSPQQQVRQYSVSGSNLVLDKFAWDNPNKNAGGMTIVDGAPLVADSGAVYTGSSFATDTALQVCYTWWNGSQETTPSPIANVALRSRESVAVSMAKRTGLQKRLYVRTGSSGNWYRQVIGTDVTSLSLSDLGAGSGWGSMVPLPTANTFPASSPAVLKSGGGNFEARGDGSGKWGPLTFNANGSMSGLLKNAAGRVIMTPTSENQTINTFVTFPAGRFSTAPSVVATPDTTVPGSTVLGVGASGPSATGFTLYFRRTSVAATGVTWIAMEMD